MATLYVEKHNTIAQRFPLKFEILRQSKKTGKVRVQDIGKSQKAETITWPEFVARFKVL